ncbi:efflux transporter periplasmic adaptor subunit [Hydrogenophaga crassostreae]|uniref:Efflux transporter periplasmic adaptor subunit n=1 Tax=Hydrogenophaga crassostreae TaxID=1763535 RepID=A0A167H6P7_9BURK|nr:efflux RND transporter periplasmic adaptor subunit [Hydrogenophaga crassostreae]AOW12525.1 efflux transporter periplasmic adaptor subunit [Hydrogenophaga crassostreae]OAD40393.1 efflux transporter periplasmic adaptor subunit [Hydrogenophaga crassostreae]
MKPSANIQRRFLLGAMALALLGALAWVALRTGPLAPVNVQTTQVTQGRVSPEVFGIGQVEARRSWMVGPTTPGRVLAVKVDVGDVVAPGQALAEMDAVDLDQRLAALDASLARGQSGRAAAQAQLADAQAKHALAQANLKRNEDLARQNFISAGALEARTQEMASANAGLQSAMANLDATAQDINRIRAERAALAEQRGSLKLVAPAAAIVSSRDAEAGSTVVAGQAVVKLIDPSSLWVKLRVDQGRSAGLAPGLVARIALRSRPGESFAGKVARVEPLADAVTEERLAQVAFDVVPPGISVGEMAEVTLQLQPTEEGLLLPNAALQSFEGSSGVWLLKDGALTFVALQVGANSLDGMVQVIPVEADALSHGDTVVMYSAKALSADTRIQVVEQLQGAAK